MTAKPRLGIIHKILLLFLVINIVGDIVNVALWWVNVPFRESINQSFIGVLAGDNNALIAGTIVLIVISVVYIIALFGLMKRNLWAPQLIIAITVINRALALVLYLISPAFAFWAIWSIILISLSYFDWHKMTTANVAA